MESSSEIKRRFNHFILLDGGLSTQMEMQGWQLRSPFWTGGPVVEGAKGVVTKAHRAFLAAGSQVISSATYQLFSSAEKPAGLAPEEFFRCYLTALDWAVETRDDFCQVQKLVSDRPLVAASIGPYGAICQDGSEYHGKYGVSRPVVENYYRARLKLISRSRVDLVAFETIPSKWELAIILDVWREFSHLLGWVSLTCQDERRTRAGDLLQDSVKPLKDVAYVVAVGLNCSDPHHMEGLIGEVKSCLEAPLLVYPNGCWDKDNEIFSLVPDDHRWLDWGKQWRDLGVMGIGGCCGMDARHIKALREALADGYADPSDLKKR